MNYKSTFWIFSGKELSTILDNQLRHLKTEIDNNSKDHILNVNEKDYVDYLIQKYTIDNLEIHFDDISVEDYEKLIPAEEFPHTFNVYLGKSYPRTVFKYFVPFSGYKELINCSIWPRSTGEVEVSIIENCICFEVINFYDDKEKIEKEVKRKISSIRSDLEKIRSRVGEFNSSLGKQAEEYYQNRKQYLLKTNNLLSSLGVPIRKRDDIPYTFAIPSQRPQKRIIINPPEVTEKGFKAEPTLDETYYSDILQIIHDVGKGFERLPSTYYNKDEETLRDHILLFLESHFDGSVTGETFNKTGKTDILFRYENSNVFIAECKFWKGKKAYLDTIDQLLGYLTWRDSKSAIVMFVKNEDFTSVINTVELETPNHLNFLGFSEKKDETLLNYRFHINGDKNREVKLAVLLFHFPLKRDLKNLQQ